MKFLVLYSISIFLEGVMSFLIKIIWLILIPTLYILIDIYLNIGYFEKLDVIVIISSCYWGLTKKFL